MDKKNMGEMLRSCMGKAGSQSKQGKCVGHGWEERAREVLIAMGKLTEFKVEDMHQDEFREVVQNAQNSRRLREASFSIVHEADEMPTATGRGLIWGEVMKW